MTFIIVQFSHSVVSDSLRPHGLQHARLLCPSPSPGVGSDSWPLSRWCHPTISSSVVPFSFCSHTHEQRHYPSFIEKQRIREVWSGLTQGCTARRWWSRNSDFCLSDSNAWELPITPQRPFIALTVCQGLASKAWKRCVLLFYMKPWEKDAVIFISDWLT